MSHVTPTADVDLMKTIAQESADRLANLIGTFLPPEGEAVATTGRRIAALGCSLAHTLGHFLGTVGVTDAGAEIILKDLREGIAAGRDFAAQIPTEAELKAAPPVH